MTSYEISIDMKKSLFHTALVALLLLMPTVAGAYDLMVDGIYYNLVDGHAVVTNSGQTGCYSGDVVIPATVTSGGTTYPVTAIGKNAFMTCYNLTHVALPPTITSIGDNAFAKCTNLTDVDIPDAVKEVGRYAFTMCDKITHVTIPDSVTTIGMQAFYACTAMQELSIGKSVTTVGDNAFGMSFQIKTLTWNAQRCFSMGALMTSGIDSVAIGNEVEVIPERFLMSSRVAHVMLPASVTTIGAEAFYDCSQLASITIPDGVTAINDYTFYKCTSLTSVVLGNSITRIGIDAFDGCSSLSCIILPGSVTTIDDYAFEGCSRLASIVIGSGVTSIGHHIFSDCNQLADVISLATMPSAVGGGQLFDNMNGYDRATLHVLPEAQSAYQQTDGWKEFSQVLGDVFLGLPGDVNGDGEVTISDASNVVVIIVNGGGSKGHTRVPSPDGGGWISTVIGDVNGDGEVNIADINAIIDYILSVNS